MIETKSRPKSASVEMLLSHYMYISIHIVKLCFKVFYKFVE